MSIDIGIAGPIGLGGGGGGSQNLQSVCTIGNSTTTNIESTTAIRVNNGTDRIEIFQNNIRWVHPGLPFNSGITISRETTPVPGPIFLQFLPSADGVYQVSLNGLLLPLITMSHTYTVKRTDWMILCDTSGGAIDIFVPTSAPAPGGISTGFSCCIKCVNDGGTGNVVAVKVPDPGVHFIEGTNGVNVGIDFATGARQSIWITVDASQNWWIASSHGL